MTADLAGWLAIVATPLLGAVYYWTNRKNDGAIGLVEFVFMIVFMVAFGVSAAYVADPQGWLTVSNPFGGG